MSKLIVEMEMPKDCIWYEDGKEGRCPFLDDGDCCRGQSDEANEAAETWGDLQKGCPIKGVLPEEHGDLIDKETAKNAFDSSFLTFRMKDGETMRGFYQRTIDELPVLIAAERKEDER